MKQVGIELVSATHGFKFEAPDGKLRVADVLNRKGGGVLKKVDSGTGKLGYGFTVSCDTHSERLQRAKIALCLAFILA